MPASVAKFVKPLNQGRGKEERTERAVEALEVLLDEVDEDADGYMEAIYMSVDSVLDFKTKKGTYGDLVLAADNADAYDGATVNASYRAVDKYMAAHPEFAATQLP